MGLRALGVTALLTVLDWGAWDWASNSGHSTIGLVAGILLVPAAALLVGLLALTVLGFARSAAERAAERRREQAREVGRGGMPPAAPQGKADSRGRIAA